MIIKNKYVDVIYRNEKSFGILIDSLALIPIIISETGDHIRDSILLLFKLLLPVVQNPEGFEIKIINSFLNNDILNKIMKDIDLSVSLKSNLIVRTEKKMIIQLFLFLYELSCRSENSSCSLEWKDRFYDLVKARKVLNDGNSFEYIAYLMYFEKHITTEDLKQFEIKYSIPFGLPDRNYVAKFSTKEFESFKISFKDMKKSPTESFAITSDFEGKNVISDDIREIKINKKNFYIHYPYYKGNLIVLGLNNDNNLGLVNSTSNHILSPRIHKQLDLDFIQIKACSQATFGLTAKGELYVTGKINPDLHYKTFTKFNKDLPDSKIVQMDFYQKNILVLTERGRFYIQGENEFDHLLPDNEYKEFTYLPRPHEDTEKVINFDLDIAHHFYITDNGKLY